MMLMPCKLCGKPCDTLADVDWHSECWVDYQDFLQDDLAPLFEQMAKEQTFDLLYALSRKELDAVIVRPD